MILDYPMQRTFKDDLLDRGVRGKVYIDSATKNSVYIVKGLQNSRSTGDNWAVQRVSFDFSNCSERTELGATKTLTDCLNDVWAGKETEELIKYEIKYHIIPPSTEPQQNLSGRVDTDL